MSKEPPSSTRNVPAGSTTNTKDECIQSNLIKCTQTFLESVQNWRRILDSIYCTIYIVLSWIRNLSIFFPHPHLSLTRGRNCCHKGASFRDPKNQTGYSSDDDEEESEKKTNTLVWDNVTQRTRGFKGPCDHPFIIQIIAKFIEFLIKREEEKRKGLVVGKEGWIAAILMSLKDLHPEKVAWASRLMVLILEIISINLLDRHENDGFRFKKEKDWGKIGDLFVDRTLRGFDRWDGQYFMHVAVYGYTKENMLAFFPLFPKLLYFPSLILYMMIGRLISISSLVLVLGWVLNTVMFVKSAKLIHELTEIMGKIGAATPVVLFFCFNPASIFYSAFYTESLFMYLTLNMMVMLYKGQLYAAIAYASISAICRSNGILNFGFIGVYCFRWNVQQHFGRNNGLWLYNVLHTGGLLLVGLIPFLAFQKYAVDTFCHNTFEGSYIPPYCQYRQLPYSYIQDHYWNVGAFRYFELKQLPNFLLASPVLYFLLIKSWRKLGSIIATVATNRNLLSVDLFAAYIPVHGIFLALFCFIFIHVQVSTRLILSAFPFFYIFVVESCQSEVVAFRQRRISWPIETSLVQYWCITYFIVGTVAYSLGYPWT